MNWNKDSSHRSIEWIILIISLLSGLVVSFIYMNGADKNLQSIAQLEQTEFERFSSAIAIHMVSFDYSTVSELSEQFEQRISATNLVVLDRYGFEVYGNNSKFEEMSEKLEYNILTDTIFEEQNLEKIAVGKIKVLTTHSDKTYYYFMAALSALAVFSLIFVPSFTVLTYYIRKHVLEPTEKLSSAITQTQETGYYVRTEYSSNSHLGKLAQQFDDMLERLEASEEKVKIVQELKQTQFEAVSHVLRNVGNSVSYFNSGDENIYISNRNHPCSGIARLLRTPLKTVSAAVKFLEDNVKTVQIVEEITEPKPNNAYELDITSLDGEYWLLVALNLEDGGFCYHVSNVSNLRKIERNLFQAKKMEAVGVLTSGIAHEFNNHLGIILGNIELALQVKRTPKKVQGHLRQANSTANIASNTIRQLLQYTRQDVQSDEVSISSFELSKNLGANADMFLDKSTSLKFQIEKRISFVVTRAGIESALLNLIKNASEAFTSKGKIIVRIRDISEGERNRPALFSEYLDYGAIDVIDDGPGISPEQHEKLFEPFFTTKQTGEGVGLGLWTAYRFAEKSSGELYYDDTTQEGSRFTLLLPTSSVNDDGKESKLSEFTPELLAGTSILLLEDEKHLMSVMVEMLETYGAKVYCASNLEQARTLINNKTKFEIAICDLRLPDGLGTEICSLLNDKNPEIYTMLLSGNLHLEEEDTDKIDALVQKPVRFNDFIGSLASLKKSSNKSKRPL